jgi:hypothetical protein
MAADSGPPFARAPLHVAIDALTAARLDLQHLQRQRAAGGPDPAELDGCLAKMTDHLDALAAALAEQRDPAAGEAG